MISKTNIAYIAGFFDGEGCIYGRGTGSFAKRPSIRIQITQKFPNILKKMQKVTNLGKVRQRSSQRSTGSYMYIITGRKNVSKFIKLILPYSIIKRQQLLLGLKLAKLIMPSRGGSKRISEIDLSKRTKLYKELKRLKKCDFQLP